MAGRAARVSAAALIIPVIQLAEVVAANKAPVRGELPVERRLESGCCPVRLRLTRWRDRRDDQLPSQDPVSRRLLNGCRRPVPKSPEVSPLMSDVQPMRSSAGISPLGYPMDPRRGSDV